MNSTNQDTLRQRAAEFAEVALVNLSTECPYRLYRDMRHPGDFPRRPREVHPIFAGSFDWHSCVEMYWLLARLLRTVPDAVPSAEITAAFDERLTVDAVAGEAETFLATQHGPRPYGWGWLLALSDELTTGDTRWADVLAPLAEAIAEEIVRWLPTAPFPVRSGVHDNSAFGLARAMPYARRRANQGDETLLTAITEAAHRWFSADTDYPLRWEPSGQDFLSAALAETELMAEVLTPPAFADWIAGFLPGLDADRPLFRPIAVTEFSDGLIAHLHGVNLSRAWGLRRLAAALPDRHPARPALLESAARHAEVELDNVSGVDYAVEHWLACYAVLYLS